MEVVVEGGGRSGYTMRIAGGYYGPIEPDLAVCERQEVEGAIRTVVSRRRRRRRIKRAVVRQVQVVVVLLLLVLAACWESRSRI